MCCELSEARICRDPECCIVTAAEACPLCGAWTKKHPELKSLRDREFCGECGEDFDPSELVVSTWEDDPYSQCEDGMLITVCRSCDEAERRENNASEGTEPATRVLTCVYCGHEYPQGTPASGSEVLTEHIRTCEKHPMRSLEERLKVLERLAGYAVTCESRNTDVWMRGLQAHLDEVLKSQGDSRRVTYDGRELRLRDVQEARIETAGPNAG